MLCNALQCSWCHTHTVRCCSAWPLVDTPPNPTAYTTLAAGLQYGNGVNEGTRTPDLLDHNQAL